MARKFKYYDIRHTMEKFPDAFYYMAIGERSNGKTYSALDYCISKYFQTGEQFAYIRRFAEDIKPKNLSQLFAGHVENGAMERHSLGNFTHVSYTKAKFFPTFIDKSGDFDPVVSMEPMGFAFDLNSMEHYKSISFPKITTIVFDEFLSREGYLTNEFILFMNTISTIVRNRTNVKIIMLGNTVNRFCPYFTEMGLYNIKTQKQGTIDLYKYGDGEDALQVVVEYCARAAGKDGKASDVYFAFNNPQLQMITTGAWEIAVYPHLVEKYRPKDVHFNVFFMFDDAILHGELVATNTNYFMFLHPKTTPIKDETEDIIYCDKPDQRWNWKYCLTKQSDKISRAIQQMIRERRIFYSDNETGEVFRNYLIWSDSVSIKK